MITKVYGVPASPFVRKVTMALDFYGVEFECLADVSPVNKTPEFQSISPLGKIPAIKDDLVSLADSSAICQYLDKRYAQQQSLYPTDPVQFAKALWFEEYADTKLLEVCGKNLFFEKVIKPKVFNQPTDDSVVNENLEVAMPAVLQYLNNHSPIEGFLCGEWSIADIAIGSQFLNARYAGFHVNEQLYPAFSAYLTRVLSTDGFMHAEQSDHVFFS
ncbi:glutathione S-transferase family protein [Vibrio sp. SCSIO 43135]|uniref:glutathione S-transferase family protein n=1 Tax=Vibrio sp. SCSIO 43135 TaxID=2819096 RepID=UPI0020761D58|nr:glutathione S-transferase family protein [Vibrio sp. SCSIO 43135]USD43570.1 glutathione S-transferase family protein [Vibrio sp. SCSIO 43135]